MSDSARKIAPTPDQIAYQLSYVISSAAIRLAVTSNLQPGGEKRLHRGYTPPMGVCPAVLQFMFQRQTLCVVLPFQPTPYPTHLIGICPVQGFSKWGPPHQTIINWLLNSKNYILRNIALLRTKLFNQLVVCRR